ncbi:MAG: SDR family oxidoreductase [Alphaproteobacteria bacterium]|nr:SDR family oxidoreductase [Alphaproteobacteria bacterium]
MQLRNKVALIVGGSSGIGEAIARKFASEGATCAIVASSNVRKANKIAREIKRKSKGYVCDVTKPAEVNKLVEKVLKDHKKIDILVNSAGIFVPTPAGDTKTSDLNRMVDVNLKGTLHVINAVVPHMKARKRGNIINMASVAGVRALPLYGIYCATKAGIVMLTKVLATELSRDGIHVNSISPGNTESPMNEYVRTDPEYKPILDFMEKLTPSGRTYSTAEEQAEMALFLASPKTGNAIYGANFVVDEGFAAGLFIAE